MTYIAGKTISVVTSTGLLPKSDVILFGNVAATMTGTIQTSLMNIGETITIIRSIGTSGTLNLKGQSGLIETTINTLAATTTLSTGGGYGSSVTFIWDGTNLLRIT